MVRANHDVQVLLTKDHVLATIFYILKYICKPEATLHSKLTIAAAHRKAFTSTSSTNTPDGRRMVLQIYNKIESHREVGVPEAISHLLGYPDHYTDMAFETTNTTQLWLYIARMQNVYEQDDHLDDGRLRSQIVPVPGGYMLLSSFDDYRHRGEALADFCLYDYRSVIYKRKLHAVLRFSIDHPQHDTHTQLCRDASDITPSLTGSLFHLNPDSTDPEQREKFFCILTALFIPWSEDVPLKRVADSWELHFQAHRPHLSPRINRRIFNIDLLHKSKEESRFDRMQQEARQAPCMNPMNVWHSDDDDDDEASDDGMPLSLADVVADVIALSRESLDFYTHEAIDASYDSGYFGAPMSEIIPNTFAILPKAHVALVFAHLDADDVPRPATIRDHSSQTILPTVFISDADDLRRQASSIAETFTLNAEQSRAFRLITDHALHCPGLPDRLMMGVFGEGGTGKTQVIKAVQAWFTSMGRSTHLLVTATTGTAAVNIQGRTVHNATGIGIEAGDIARTSKVTSKMSALWEGRSYMIVDEVSMLSCQTMVSLNAQLMKIKNRPSMSFGGVNLVFFGDFLQFSAVSRLDLYMQNPENKYALGHDLWRSLNACVILRQQMRQAEDPAYAALLQRVRRHDPSDHDLVALNSRVSAPLSDFWDTTVIVRRHCLRQAINRKRVQQASLASGVAITYCVAKIADRKGMSVQAAYNICGGEGNSKGDAILCLLPGTPLMITQNVRVSHGISPRLCFHPSLTRVTSGLANGSRVKFFGFSASFPIEPGSSVHPPDYMLVTCSDPNIVVPGLPPSVLPIRPIKFTYKSGTRKASLYQFPVTLAYAITDYKCQGLTFDRVSIDLKRPPTGFASGASAYVQLSRCRALDRLSIIRPFDPSELRTKLSNELSDELKWEEDLDRATRIYYGPA